MTWSKLGYLARCSKIKPAHTGVACITFFVLPDTYNDKSFGDSGEDSDAGQKKGLVDALRVPTIAIAAYSIICAAISIGFIQATLEPHLRQFGLSPIMMGKTDTFILKLIF